MLLHTLFDQAHQLTTTGAHHAVVLADPATSGSTGFDIHMTAPPNGDKIKLLLGVGLWVAFAGLVGLGIMSGFKFAEAFADGHASRGQKFMVAGVAIGAVITASAASWVTFFM